MKVLNWLKIAQDLAGLDWDCRRLGLASPGGSRLAGGLKGTARPHHFAASLPRCHHLADLATTVRSFPGAAARILDSRHWWVYSLSVSQILTSLRHLLYSFLSHSTTQVSVKCYCVNIFGNCQIGHFTCGSFFRFLVNSHRSISQLHWFKMLVISLSSTHSQINFFRFLVNSHHHYFFLFCFSLYSLQSISHISMLFFFFFFAFLLSVVYYLIINC